MKKPIRDEIERGPFPYDEGWGWLYRAVDRIAPAGRAMRGALCRYFFPNGMERWRAGRIYRLLGVHWFGSVIPTGGIVVRRVTKARMADGTSPSRTRLSIWSEMCTRSCTTGGRAPELSSCLPAVVGGEKIAAFLIILRFPGRGAVKLSFFRWKRFSIGAN